MNYCRLISLGHILQSHVFLTRGCAQFSDHGHNFQPILLISLLHRRCVILVDAVTTTVFNYVRRGLFERDKLTVATMLTLKILVNDGILAQEEVDYLVMSKVRRSTLVKNEASHCLFL